MSSRFSGALQLTNLDDFITPSQECIKPVEILKNKTKTGSKIKIQDDGAYMEVSEEGSVPLAKVEITLADCLACSGCITSAESILITQQSQEEILRIFEENKTLKLQGKEDEMKYIVISLSVQSVLSIAQYFNLQPAETMEKLSSYFKRLGADLVLEMSAADDITLIQSAKEFCERYRAHDAGMKNQIPMLASSCPGWVCYAEKTHGNFILPYISTVTSPQQTMGILVKHHLAEKLNINPSKIYHITLMPCYDKKLEASRQDFYEELIKSRTVDCVITSIEVQQMMQDQQTNLAEFSPSKIDKPFGVSDNSDAVLFGHDGSGSGGYADYIFHYAAKHLFGQPDVQLEYKNLRNPDFREAILEANGKVVLKFAIVNGFRNIQNFVQKLKRKKCEYHYIEVMACPTGCLNGGAQIRPQDGSQPRELALKLDDTYRSLPKSVPELNPVVKDIYENWLENRENSEIAFVTQYHEVEKLNTALAIKW